MKIINAKNRSRDFDRQVGPETIRDLNEYEAEDNYRDYKVEAEEVDIPDITTDEEAEGMLADGYVQTGEPFGESLGDFGDIGRSQEGLPGEPPVEEEPIVKKREDVEQADEVDESVAAETEIDERVDEPATAIEAVQEAMDEHRVLEIFYVTRGRGGRDERYFLKRERGLSKEDGGGVNIHRIVEPHYIYTAGNGREIVITYDRSVRRVRSFIINNIYDYNFTKNRKTKKDQYFKPRNRVMPSTLSGSRKGIKTMKNINDTLVKIASTLDSKGLHKSSEVVKNAEKALSNYKMAQYVGVQGYWLKNRRCWDNCYRQKRTSKPGSSAQEVWMECWDEYREAINNPKSTWAKYASGRDTIKVSEREEQSWNKVFAGKVENKMKKGLSRPEAIYTVIEAESQAYTTKMITASSNLMILADTLVSEGYEEVGKQAAKMSIELLKESEIKGNPGFWGRQMDKFNTWRTGKGGHSDVVKKIQDLINRANQLANMFFAKKPQQQVKTQSSTPSGFIIEAGKGTRIVEAQITPGADPKTYQPKTKPVPGEQQVFDFAKPKPGDKDGDDKPDAEDNDDSPADGKADTPQPEDNATNTTGGDGVADGEQDLNKNNQPDGQEDKNKNNQPDGQEDVNKNNTPDGQEDQAADTPEAPEGDTNQDGKVDANDQQTGEQPESPRAAYEALVNDVMTMVGDFSGLQQTANDPKVAQLVTETTPLLQKFIGSKNTIAQMPKGPERVKFLRDTLGTLVQNLQGVLAKQGPAAQPGAETGGMPPAGAETGGMPPTGNQMPPGGNQLGGDASKLVQVATSGQYGDAKAVQGLVRSLNSGALKDGVLEWVTNFFEEQGVPFTFANYTQFKNDLGAAAVNPAISNQRV